jgi:hypothetical protein
MLDTAGDQPKDAEFNVFSVEFWVNGIFPDKVP